MTPFDVVKTRLQTQATPQPPPPLFQPQPSPSTSAGTQATCCQKTFFTTNASESLLCRFDPRQSSAFLPSAGGPSSQSVGVAASSHAAASGGIRPFSRTAMAALIPATPAFASIGGGPAAASMILSSSEAACAYPDSATASRALHAPAATSANRPATGIFDAFALIVRNEGAPALWRGLSPSLAMSVPSQAVYMVGYDFLRRSSFTHAPSIFWTSPDVRPSATGDGLTPRYRTFLAPLVTGSVSRTAVAVLFSPLELVRTRLQALPHSSSSSTASNILRSTFSAVRSEGIISLWRGLGATLWRDVPFSAVYWASYEYTRRRLTGGKGLGERHEGEKKGKTILASFIAGSTSGCLAAIVTNPFDVVKTRRQASGMDGAAVEEGKAGTLRTLRQVSREGALMRGLTPRLAKIVPACGIMIVRPSARPLW